MNSQKISENVEEAEMLKHLKAEKDAQNQLEMEVLIHLKSVVLPDPFSPTMPYTLPASKHTLMLFKTCFEPNCFDKLFIFIILKFL